mmetsp:Transcript_56560/g.143091  ORF Transcript_56560/g.143091 Transcript_56560/m.143091 type:complete len:267 (-) Transcript_56560:382-1182(-)
MPVHLQIPADQDSDDEPGDGAADVGSMAGVLLGEGHDIAEDVHGDQEHKEYDGWNAEFLLAPIHDQVCKVYADQGVATTRATHHGSVRIGEHVAQGAAQDTHVEHHGRPPMPVQTLQRDAEHHAKEDIHQGVHGSNMSELVGDPTPNLLAVVLAIGSRPLQDRHTWRNAVQPRFGLQGVSLRGQPILDGEDEPQEEDRHALERHEPWNLLLLYQVFHHFHLCSLAVHLRGNEVFDAYFTIPARVRRFRLRLALWTRARRNVLDRSL